MKVVILCGGAGTRLREETEFRPKPMVNIGSRPILWHIMKGYACQGYNDFVLALGYKGEMIKDYFCHYEIMNNDVTLELGKPDSFSIHGSHEEAGWKITLADTGEATLKGGRIKRVQKYIGQNPFMLTYGDGVANVDSERLLEFHQSHGKMVTLTGISPVAQFGELKVKENVVESFSEKPDKSHNSALISGGFFVCNPGIFDYLTPDEHCDFEFGALEKVANEGQLMVYEHDGFWACMDTLRDTERLNRMWSNGNAPWKIW
jgi:glucose-1-phosphate cytidylyltransferase